MDYCINCGVDVTPDNSHCEYRRFSRRDEFGNIVPSALREWICDECMDYEADMKFYVTKRLGKLIAARHPRTFSQDRFEIPKWVVELIEDELNDEGYTCFEVRKLERR